MSERESHEQPRAPGSGRPEAAASFPFGAAMWAGLVADGGERQQQALGLTQPTISHHLKILVEAEIFTRDKRGLWAYYAIIPEALSALSAVPSTTR